MLLKLLGQVSSFIPLRERWDGPPAWRPGALSSTADDERRSWPHCAPGPCAPGQTGATHVTKAAAAMNPSSNTAGFAKPRRAMTVVMRWPRPGPNYRRRCRSVSTHIEKLCRTRFLRCCGCGHGDRVRWMLVTVLVGAIRACVSAALSHTGTRDRAFAALAPNGHRFGGSRAACVRRTTSPKAAEAALALALALVEAHAAERARAYTFRYRMCTCEHPFHA